MPNQWLVIQQLDQQLKEWQVLNQKYGRPRLGWIKTLRTALGMTVQQLGQRLGVSHSRISQLEAAEIENAVTLHSLKEAAEALNCELIYAIVPKHSSSLESIIHTRAEELANESVSTVAHSMALEAQSVKPCVLKKQKEELTKSFAEHINKKLWITFSPTYQTSEASKKYSIKNKKSKK